MTHRQIPQADDALFAGSAYEKARLNLDASEARHAAMLAHHETLHPDRMRADSAKRQANANAAAARKGISPPQEAVLHQLGLAGISSEMADFVLAQVAKGRLNPTQRALPLLPFAVPTVEELIDMHSRLDSNRTKKLLHENARLDRLGESDAYSQHDEQVNKKAAARRRSANWADPKNERGEYKRWLCTFMPVDPKSRVTYNEGPPKSWCAWPWVFEWDPDENVLTTLDGFCALGALKDLPAPWPEWQRARHRLDDWVMANGPSRAAMDAALKRHLPTRSEDANTGLGEAGPEVVRNR